MSAQRESPLLRIADAMARGVLVDWDEETSRYAHLKGELESLREVERMAHAHARLKSEEDSDLLSAKRSLTTASIP